ncbi:MAG: metal ABC transporter substrate-binding protein, partial [Coprothermobacterota bacterium]|nr:metal ABC transporter substrate-binding protein [Coprothermobacterota bacterium]
QNVAGDRFEVESLLPLGADPHAFQPSPADIAKVSQCQALITNGAGFESFLGKLLEAAGNGPQLIVACEGLPSRISREGEETEDPHFWLDPTLVIRYTENICDGFSLADPAGKELYLQNATSYSEKLRVLDRWMMDQVQQIPVEKRLLVTNHESLGYFADRYSFHLVGTVIPSFSTDSAPSAFQMAQLVDQIRATGVQAIFLETGANPQLARQVAGEAGVKVVTELFTHSLTAPGGEAPTYLEMMRWDTLAIIQALRE